MSIIFNGLNSLLNFVFNITGDWGIAIVLLTLFIRIILLPLSIKQKINLNKQQSLQEKTEALKIKYKNNKKKLDEEILKLQQENFKTMIGCLSSLLQLPIISSLYYVIIRMPVDAGTYLIPWITSIKLPDKYFIIPFIYILVSLMPNLLPYIKFLNFKKQNNINVSNLLVTIVFSLIISIKAPIALGIYFITTSLFSLIEEIGFKLYYNKITINKA